jgi:hypothetical protein
MVRWRERPDEEVALVALLPAADTEAVLFEDSPAGRIRHRGASRNDVDQAIRREKPDDRTYRGSCDASSTHGSVHAIADLDRRVVRRTNRAHLSQHFARSEVNDDIAAIERGTEQLSVSYSGFSPSGLATTTV